jgi:hypothetical protein
MKSKRMVFRVRLDLHPDKTEDDVVRELVEAAERLLQVGPSEPDGYWAWGVYEIDPIEGGVEEWERERDEVSAAP